MLNVLVIQVNVVRLLVVHHLEVQLVSPIVVWPVEEMVETGVAVVVISKIPLHVSARYALFLQTQCTRSILDSQTEFPSRY